MTRGPESTAHAGIDPVPRLLIVNGLPGSGKTTLSRELAPRLGLPLISKDDIKELLFDQLGWSDREQSKRFGGAAALVADPEEDVGAGAEDVDVLREGEVVEETVGDEEDLFVLEQSGGFEGEP